MPVTLKEVMTVNPMSVMENQTALEVSEIFKTNKFHHMPVVNDMGDVIGMVSKTDLDQHAIGLSLFSNVKREQQTDALYATMLVGYFMTKDVFTLSSENAIDDAYALFREHNFRALPIVDEGHLTGIVTPIDLVKPFIER